LYDLPTRQAEETTEVHCKLRITPDPTDPHIATGAVVNYKARAAFVSSFIRDVCRKEPRAGKRYQFCRYLPTMGVLAIMPRGRFI